MSRPVLIPEAEAYIKAFNALEEVRIARLAAKAERDNAVAKMAQLAEKENAAQAAFTAAKAALKAKL